MAFRSFLLIVRRENAAFRHTKVCVSKVVLKENNVELAETMKGSENLKRFSAFSLTSKRFKRSIASRGGKELKWIKRTGRMSLKLANLPPATIARFFSILAVTSIFFCWTALFNPSKWWARWRIVVLFCSRCRAAMAAIAERREYGNTLRTSL